MDPLQEENNPADNNLNYGSLDVDNTNNEEKPSCLENNSDEKDAAPAFVITDENNPPQELKYDPAENKNPLEFVNVIIPEKSKEDIKNESLLITDENNQPQELKYDPAENKNPLEFVNVIIPEKSEEDIKNESLLITDENNQPQELKYDPAENKNPLEFVNVIIPEKSEEDIKNESLLITDENNQPQELKDDPVVFDRVTTIRDFVILADESIETDVKDATISSLITDYFHPQELKDDPVENNNPMECVIAPEKGKEEYKNNQPQESKDDTTNNNPAEFSIAPEKIKEEEGKLPEEVMDITTFVKSNDVKNVNTSLLITDENNQPQELKDDPSENNTPMECVIVADKSVETDVKVATTSLMTDENNEPQESENYPVEFVNVIIPVKSEDVKNESFLNTDENNTPQESSNPMEFVIAAEKSKEDVKNVNTSLLITDENNQSQELKDDPAENNTPMECVIVPDKSIETDVKDATISSLITGENSTPQESKNDPAENNNPVESFIAPEKIGDDQVEGKLPGEVIEITTLTADDKKQGDEYLHDHNELDTKQFGLKPGSDDAFSVDSSSDSSSSSSTSSSSSDDEMDVGDDEDDVVEIPKKLSPVVEENQEELKELRENGETTNFPHFPIYRDINDSKSSSEDSTSSSASDMEDNVTDYPKKQKSPFRKDGESEERKLRPRVKGEIFPEELPALENLNICVGDDVDLQILGKITSVISNIAVVQAEFPSPIDQDSVVFLNDRTCIGKVHDIIGQVCAPFYTVLLDTDNTSIPLDTEIYCAPKEEEYTKYVFVNDLKNLKGSDASWEHDIEPPEKFLDYSDDEQERMIKKLNKCKNSAKANGDSKDDSDDGNGKSQQKDKSASNSSRISNPRKSRKRDHNGGANFHSFQDASQRSMFACSAAWPPGNDHGSFTSGPSPAPPPHYQQPNNPTFYQDHNQHNQPTWHSNYAPPNPPVGMMMQPQPWNYHQNPSNMQPYPGSYPHHHPQNWQPFIPTPYNQQPRFHGQWRQPYNPQGPPRPPGSFDMRNPAPRFSQPPHFPGFFP